jgi:hypothetical protein
MVTRFTRRQVLRWGLAGGAAVVLPASTWLGCGDHDESAPLPTATPTTVPPTATATPVSPFLSPDEMAVVHAVTGRVIPTDALLPGAVEAGAAEYINRLLSILPDEQSPGNVFGGGPFSGRTPFPDPSTGTASNQFPPDDFADFIPLTRLQLLSWRVQLLGTAAVPGSDFNTAVLGPVVGLRDQYKTGLADIQSKSQAMFSADFTTLSPTQQDTVLQAIDPNFFDLISEHTLEGMFCAPEYGGNSNGIGWTLIGYDGDSQPLGYSIFDATQMTYQERPDKPNSTADPDEDFSGVDATTQQFLNVLVRLAGSPHFP